MIVIENLIRIKQGLIEIFQPHLNFFKQTKTGKR